jgi:hypothetical protein
VTSYRLGLLATGICALWGCRAPASAAFSGRWQGGSRPPSEPISIAVTLRAYGDSLRGWGVARTDGGSFPIGAEGAVARTDSGATVSLSLSPWRAGVVEVNAAQVSGRLTVKGIITGRLRTDAGLGIDAGVPIELRRPE